MINFFVTSSDSEFAAEYYREVPDTSAIASTRTDAIKFLK